MKHDLGMPYAEMKEAARLPMPDKHYPSFHIEGKESLDLPQEGEMTISFKLVSESNSTNEKGEKRYSCTVEVMSIEDVEGEADDAPAHGSDKSVSSILDGLMESYSKLKNSSEEY